MSRGRRTESGGLPLGEHPAETLDDLARLDRALDGLDVLAEGGDGDGGDLVAPELGQELLLGRDVEVGVRLDLFLAERASRHQHDLSSCSKRVDAHPDALHVEGHAVDRNALVIRGLEDEVLPRAVDEALAQVLDGLFELLRQQDLVRKGGEGEVKVFRELAVLQSGGLRRPVSTQTWLQRRRERRTFERECQIFSMSWVRVEVRLDIGVEPT